MPNPRAQKPLTLDQVKKELGGAAFGIYPKAGKRGQRKPINFNESVFDPNLGADPRAMEYPFGELDLSVPTKANRELSQRMTEREVDLKRQADQDMSPLEKLAGGIQAGRLIGSALTQSVKSIPTAITKGGKAAEDYIAENIYQPNVPKAYEYAGNVADFLTSLESDYKIPPIIPELTALQNVVGPASRQAGRAAKRGAVQGGMKLERAMEPVVKRALESGGLPREMVMAMGANSQSNVVKPKGGNFITGSVEGALKDLKRPDRMTGGRKDPSESLAEMKARYTPEAIAELPPELRATVIAGFQDLEKKVALNNWVDRNLGGYIKNEMATPQDPVRLYLDRRSAEIDQKFAKDIERVERIQQRAAAEEDPRRKANFERQAQIAKDEAEAERDLSQKYISQMPSSEFDFASTFLPEKLAVKRMEAGFDPGDVGVSNAARGWERIADEKINVSTAGRHTSPLTPSEIRQGYTSTVDNNPWLTKLDPDTPVYYPEGGNYFAQDLGFDHIVDVLREDVNSGRIRPEQLSKVSMDQAVRRTAEYDRDLAVKMSAERASARAGLPVYKDYPEGYKWVELNTPGAFAAESQAMGHSVRGYEPPKGHPDWVEGSGDSGYSNYGVGGWEAIKSGKAKVYSLVDAKGEPHVTVEVEAGKPWNERSGIFYDNPELESSWQRFSQEASLEEKAKGLNRPSNYIERYPEWLKANEPETYAKYAKVFEEGPPKVRQIKGKSNERPIEKYDPFTQDFVKSGKWSDVRDLENTGLFKLGNDYMTEAEAAAKYKPMTQEALNFLETHPAFEQHRAADRAFNQFRGDVYSPEYKEIDSAAGRSVSQNVPYTYRELRALLSSPEDFTDRGGTIYEPISTAIERLNQAKRELGIDLPPDEGMARGGRVHFSNNPDTMQLELAGGGGVRMQVGGAMKMASKAAKGALPAVERDANLAKFLEQSKVPQRLYHGTTATEGGKGTEAIRRIKPSKEGALGSGFYMTPKADFAGSYAGYSPSGVHQTDSGAPSTGGNVLPVYTQMRNPLIIEGKGDPMVEALTKLGMDEDSASKMVERAYEQKGYIGKQVQQRAQAAGYDGLLQYRDGELSEVVSYRPNAVKSAIGNQGTYDINDPDLSKAKGGAVRMQVGGAMKAAAKAPVKPRIVQAPNVIIPGTLSQLKEAMRQSKGEYGVRRIERAADEVKNLEKMYKEQALRESFLGDNAKAVVTMNPADFERYAKQLEGRTPADIGPKMSELAKQGEIDKYTVPTDEYIQHLMRVQGGFDQVPYLNLYKDEVGLPSYPEVRGHEGRHRNRALSAQGEESSLVQINPRGDLREGLPRRSQEEFIEALKEELGRSDQLVYPEADPYRPPIKFPEPYAKGGNVRKAAGGEITADDLILEERML
jgi:hypothetical protein